MDEARFMEWLEKSLDGSAAVREQDAVIEAAQCTPALARALYRHIAMDAALRALRHDVNPFIARLKASAPAPDIAWEQNGPARFYLLLDKCFEGTATPDEEREVIAAAQQNPALARAIYNQTALDAALNAMCHKPGAFTAHALSTLTRSDSGAAFARKMRLKIATEIGDKAPSPVPAPTVCNLQRRRTRHIAFQRILLPLAAAAALIAMVSGMFYYEQRQAVIVAVEQVHGAATWGKRTIRPDMMIDQRHLVQLEEESVVRLRYRDGSTLELKCGAQVRVTGVNGAKQVHVRHGLALADVARQPSAKPMMLHTQNAHLTVRGTQFLLLVTPGMNRLDVREGTVDLAHDGKSVRVNAGRFAAVKPGLPLQTHASTGEELSPACGGMFYLKYAKIYAKKGFILRELEVKYKGAGDRLRPAQLLKQTQHQGLRASVVQEPETALLLEDNDPGPSQMIIPWKKVKGDGFEIHYTVSGLKSIPGKKAGTCSFSVNRKTLLKPDKYPEKVHPYQRTSVLDKPKHDFHYRFLKVGQMADGQPVYEWIWTQDNSILLGSNWMLGTPDALIISLNDVSIRLEEFDVTQIKVDH